MNPNQWGVISLIASALVLEGLDIQIMSFAAPAIARDWQVSAPAMGPVIGAALIGTLVGGAFGGYVGDRLGRRPTLIASVVFFATFTALAALSTDVTMLTFLRFIAGLGFGAALPAATALAAEWTPVHLRSRVVTLLILGMPIGGIIGAAICSWAVPTFGWRIAFVAAGILPLIVAGLMYFWLPESPEFKSINDSATPDEQLSAGHGPRNNGSGRIAFTTLLSREYLRVTIGLSMAFFCALLVSYLFLNWLPILLTSVGETDAFAIRAALFLNVLGMVTTLLTGWLVHRLGSRVGLLVVLVPAIIAMTIAALGTYTALNSGESPTLYLLLGALIGGAACMGAQAGQVGLAAHAFAVENRASGIGLTGSIGRTGSIVSALGGGALIAAQPSPVVFLSVVAVTLVFGAVGVLVVNRHSGATASSAR